MCIHSTVDDTDHEILQNVGDSIMGNQNDSSTIVDVDVNTSDNLNRSKRPRDVLEVNNYTVNKMPRLNSTIHVVRHTDNNGIKINNKNINESSNHMNLDNNNEEFPIMNYTFNIGSNART